MNKQDEYHFFLLQAISKPELSNRKYFFDRELKKLFSILYDGNLSPHYRNKYLKPNRETVEFFEIEIIKIKTNDSSITELQPIPTQEKRTFLDSFIEKYVHDNRLKSTLKNELTDFGKNSELEFQTDLKTLSREVFVNYDRERALFLYDKIVKNYTFIDLEEILDVIW